MFQNFAQIILLEYYIEIVLMYKCVLNMDFCRGQYKSELLPFDKYELIKKKKEEES